MLILFIVCVNPITLPFAICLCVQMNVLLLVLSRPKTRFVSFRRWLNVEIRGILFIILLVIFCYFISLCFFALLFVGFFGSFFGQPYDK